MRSWTAPSLSKTHRLGPTPQCSDSATGGLKDLTPLGERASLYVCGITPYDATHLGHAATYVAFDLLNRAWRNAGFAVDYVQNVTDVDDPLLERASATEQDWVELAHEQTELFRTDMEALRVLPPKAYVGVVEGLDLVTAMLGELQAADLVYRVDDDLYCRMDADPRFGEVSGWQRDVMLEVFAERGGDPAREGKESALDCLLWRGAQPGEPSWDSPFGPGRPGWHIECAAISTAHLGANIDVQGGGSDLVFPHHEMSASHVRMANPGCNFAAAYVHAGMVGYQGEKMSKSKGNLVLVSQLRDSGVPPRRIRLALLDKHYRENWEWTDECLARAQLREDLWRQAFDTSRPGAMQTAEQVLRCLAQDLDAPSALRVVDSWAKGDPIRGATGQSGGDPDDAVAVLRDCLDAALGLTF